LFPLVDLHLYIYVHTDTNQQWDEIVPAYIDKAIPSDVLKEGTSQNPFITTAE